MWTVGLVPLKGKSCQQGKNLLGALLQLAEIVVHLLLEGLVLLQQPVVVVDGVVAVGGGAEGIDDVNPLHFDDAAAAAAVVVVVAAAAAAASAGGADQKIQPGYLKCNLKP